jgi:two-component system sensor histidine kinase and response regulator WspE
MSTDDLSHASLLDLFRMEADTQGQVLTSGLLALERDPTASADLESCMRAAHSLKGAAGIVGLDAGVRLAHAMEDCFVSAQHGHIALGAEHVDLLLGGTDLLMRLAQAPDPAGQLHGADVEACLLELARILQDCEPEEGRDDASASDPDPREKVVPPAGTIAPATAADPTGSAERSDRVLRVTADNLNRLLGLAGESLVESRWMRPFADSLGRLKRMQRESTKALSDVHEALPTRPVDPQLQDALARAQRSAAECEHFLTLRLAELESFDGRAFNLSHRLYDEAIACRMRPFADGVQGLPRLIRDLAQSLGRRVRFEIVGEATQVDRDILMKLDAPLGHLLRNAVDHGIEPPDERRAAGKPAEGVLRLEVRHRAGALHVVVSDDGRGIDLDHVRRAIVERHLITPETAGKLSDDELREFLFLPGFSMKGTVTEISGRGVGLDVVRDMVKQVRGTVRVSSELGKGTRFVLQLPVTLSVVRTLLADIGGEPYAFPLATIVRTLKLAPETIGRLEGREHFECDGQRVGLLTAHQVFGVDPPASPSRELSVIVLGDEVHTYGLVVDRFRGERELVVQPLDPRIGKITGVAAGALMEDGSPVLIVDGEDLMRSIDRIVSTGRLSHITPGPVAGARRRKRVLVVDDSLTVRELERKLLDSRGYDVEVAVDGMDGWHTVRTGHFDLVVTDVDMPRMDGIELLTLINADPNLKSVPVMIVSYKDRDEDRRRGLEAGAAYYLTKGGFQDDTLLQAVVDLIGEASA